MPQALALWALHPAAARWGLSRLHVRPELGLRHGHQRRRGHRQVLVRRWRCMRLVLRGRLVLWGRLQRGRLGLRLGLVWWGQGGVQGPLHAGLCVRGQKRLSRARQEGLPRRDEGPRGC